MPPRDQDKAAEAVRAEEEGRLDEAVTLYREAGYPLTADSLQEIIDEERETDTSESRDN